MDISNRMKYYEIRTRRVWLLVLLLVPREMVVVVLVLLLVLLLLLLLLALLGGVPGGERRKGNIYPDARETPYVFFCYAMPSSLSSLAMVSSLITIRCFACSVTRQLAQQACVAYTIFRAGLQTMQRQDNI